MRILLGGLTHEANTFCPHAAELSDFDSRQVMRGEQMLENWQQTRTEQAGALSILQPHARLCRRPDLSGARALRRSRSGTRPTLPSVTSCSPASRLRSRPTACCWSCTGR